MPATPDERARLEMLAEIQPGANVDPLDTSAASIDEGLLGPGFMRRSLAGFVKLRDAVNQLAQGLGIVQANQRAQTTALEAESKARAALEPRIEKLEKGATATDQAITSLETRTAATEATTAELHDGYTVLEERVTALEPPPSEPAPSEGPA